MSTEQDKNSSNVARLVACALTFDCLGGFDDAADALIELERLDRSLACEITLKILNDDIGDIYYQAFAFYILYSASLGSAVEYIRSNASTENSRVLGAMIQSVTNDVGVVEGRDKVLEAASILKDVLSRRSAEDLSSIAEKVEDFMRVYQ